MNMQSRQEENGWLTGEREYTPANLKSPWSIGRANEEAEKAGYKGEHTFREWLKLKKLDDRSQGQIRQLGQSYDEGVSREHQDAVERHRGKVSAKAASDLEVEVASALVNYGAGKSEARDAAREAVKGGGGFDAVFKRALKMTAHTKTNPKGYQVWTRHFEEPRTLLFNGKVFPTKKAAEDAWHDTAPGRNDHMIVVPVSSNPAGHGHWEEFTTENAAKKYARLMEGEGKVVTRLRKAVKVEDGPVSGQRSNPIQDPNSSGQGYDPDHHSPFDSVLSKFGYSYSHTTPVHYRDGGVRMHHTFKRGNHNVSVEKDSRGEWRWDAGHGGSGRGRSGMYANDLNKYLDGVTKRKSNPEGPASDMYESFHGQPSTQIVEFEEQEHYHEYLAELGVCCGVLVETEQGQVQAIGLSGYQWKGKGKDAGFVTGRDVRSNPRSRRHRGPFRQASDLFLGGAQQLDDTLGDVLAGKNPKRTTVSDYLNETVNLGGLSMSRGEAYKELTKIAISQGHSKADAQRLADRWMQGHDRKRNPPDPIDPNTTLLSSNEDGTQLYLVGGDQSLDISTLGIEGDAATKELVTIGDVCKVYYETEKDFDKFETIQYHHELGEETGELPVLAYDRLNKRLLFVGGAYRIERPLMETSAGIEN
jgi:hypothetical protein